MRSNLSATAICVVAPMILSPPGDIADHLSADPSVRTASTSGGGSLPTSAPRLYAGAIEVGISGSLTSVEGNARAAVEVRCGSFSGADVGLVGYEFRASYTHVSALDALGIEGALSWQRPVGSGGNYAFVAGAGGVRQEWLGSFRQARYPIGVDAGLRTLIGQRAGVRVEYHVRRVLKDPVEDFTEHQDSSDSRSSSATLRPRDFAASPGIERRGGRPSCTHFHGGASIAPKRLGARHENGVPRPPRSVAPPTNPLAILSREC